MWMDWWRSALTQLLACAIAGVLLSGKVETSCGCRLPSTCKKAAATA
jgi:hypothetical protein